MHRSIPDYRPLEFNKVTDYGPDAEWFVVTERRSLVQDMQDFTRVVISDWTYSVDDLQRLIGIAYVQGEPVKLLEYIANKIKHPTPIKFVLKEHYGKDTWGWEYEMFITKDGQKDKAVVWSVLSECNYTKRDLEEIRVYAVKQNEPAELLAWIDDALTRAGDKRVPCLD